MMRMDLKRKSNIHKIILACTVLLFFRLPSVFAGAEDQPPVLPLAAPGTWNGLSTVQDSGGECGVLPLTGTEAVFTYPDGQRGWYNKGFRLENDGTRDWRDYFGVALELKLPDDRPVELGVQIKIPKQEARPTFVEATKATIPLRGTGWHAVTLPWSAFDFQQAQPSFLKFAKELRLSARALDGAKNGEALTRNIRLVKGMSVALECAVRGKPAEQGKQAEYGVRVGNCTGERQCVMLDIQRHGWESMAASVEPAMMQLAPGESRECKVRVTVSSRVPPGGRETQTLRAIANGHGESAATLSFVTASALPHPYILQTSEGWKEIREKVKKFAWAREEQEKYVALADKWKVPEVPDASKIVNTTDTMGPYLFATPEEKNLLAAAYSWQLTGKKYYAEKVKLFLMRFSDPKTGYPATFRGCNQGFVQEGHFMQNIAKSHDMILDSGTLNGAEREQVENAFRVFNESVRLELNNGAINNWNVSEIIGVLYASLSMQDLALADRCLEGPSGVVDQMRHGIMDDGWWYECSVSYNIWVATEFSQVAVAMRPWGMDLANAWLPGGYSRNYSLVAWSMQPGLYGMNFDKFGPVTQPCVNLKRMWDALPVFGDYQGTIFGINDTTEKPLYGNGGYEIAYYLYRDPVYAGIIKRGKERDLIYGVGELPETTPDLSDRSAYADNVGVAMLRSKAKEPRERIEAVLHYGTHGGFHGHFDRTNLLALMRYGKSFYNPEMIWYSYAPYMYKFYVQSSMSKNMVVVDQKQQEPVESPRLLFHTGDLFQAAAVETNARWSDPPFGGMIYTDQPAKNLAEKQWLEGRSFPIPPDAQYGEIGPYSDRVLQRRALVVMDDYIVLADYLKAEQKHTFDSLLQIKGFRSLEASEKKMARHDGQMTTDGKSAAQFITDCDWFTAKAPARASFENDGLKLDVISLWPKNQEIMVATAPENMPVNKQIFFKVSGDGKTLAEGRFGAWILGRDTIDVSLEGVKSLALETRVAQSKSPTIFWASARIITTDGRELLLSDLPLAQENSRPAEKGKDYAGGVVKIAGIPYASAVPGQPKDDKKAAMTRVDLTGLKAARFKAVIGGDFPVGDESQMRKTYSIRSQGREARFLTIVEPFEKDSKITSAEAAGPDKLRVKLTDGREQEITLKELDGAGKVEVRVVESRDGKTLREESTSGK